MVAVDIYRGELTDEILSVADGYKFKPYFFITAAPEAGLNKIFSNHVERFLQKSSASENAAFFIARNDKREIVGIAGAEWLDFDTAALNAESGRVPFVAVVPEEYKDAAPVAYELIESCMEWLGKRKVVFTNIRLAAMELPAIHAVERHGFYLVDNGFTAIYHKDSVQEYEKGGYEIRLFAEKDLPVVMDILAGAYQTDRFHMDPEIKNEDAEELYRVWVHHMCMNPKDQEWVLIAERKGTIKGFFQYEYNREFSAATGIKLFSYGPAAVVRDRTALGAYYSLLSFAINDSIMRGGIYAMTRIPFAIQPILKLTLRLGPSFMANDLTFHHWVK
ncbi:MAG TPA: hypothetical protein VGB30_10935 [bacterium]|jgi:hypothetical protein